MEDDSRPESPRPPEGDATTLHVRAAAGGSGESLEWIVERFTPALKVQARFRMGAELSAKLEPEDVVNDVWAVTLPRLPGLDARDGRLTPVLMRFLSTTLIQQVNNRLRKRLAGTLGESAAEADPFQLLPDATRGPVTRAVGAEQVGLVQRTLEGLEPRDRDLIVLRAIEQRTNQETAEALGIAPNTAAQAYRRALERLRRELPGSVFDEL